MSKRQSRSYVESGSEGSSRDPVGEKGGKMGVKIGSMNKEKTSPVSRRGHFKHIGQYLVCLGMHIMIGGTKSLNVYRGW